MAITIIKGITAVALSLSDLYNQTSINGNYQANPTDNYIYVNTGSTVQITLPANPIIDNPIIIKDVTGQAHANNITIIGTVDGVVNPIIGSNYGGAGLVWNGTGWSEIF